MQLSDLFRRSRRVEIGPDSVKIGVSQDRLAALLGSNELEFTRDRPIDPSDDVLTLTAPVQLTRVGREMKLLVDNSNDNRSPDTGLLQVVTRAYDVQRRLAEDTTLTVHYIAHQERVTSDYLYIVLRLRWLAPRISPRRSSTVSSHHSQCQALDAADSQLPADWSEQRALLGFR